jgi:hypothetical protein
MVEEFTDQRSRNTKVGESVSIDRLPPTIPPTLAPCSVSESCPSYTRMVEEFTVQRSRNKSVGESVSIDTLLTTLSTC